MPGPYQKELGERLRAFGFQPVEIDAPTLDNVRQGLPAAGIERLGERLFDVALIVGRSARRTVGRTRRRPAETGSAAGPIGTRVRSSSEAALRRRPFRIPRPIRIDGRFAGVAPRRLVYRARVGRARVGRAFVGGRAAHAILLRRRADGHEQRPGSDQSGDQ